MSIENYSEFVDSLELNEFTEYKELVNLLYEKSIIPIMYQTYFLEGYSTIYADVEMTNTSERFQEQPCQAFMYLETNSDKINLLNSLKSYTVKYANFLRTFQRVMRICWENTQALIKMQKENVDIQIKEEEYQKLFALFDEHPEQLKDILLEKENITENKETIFQIIRKQICLQKLILRNQSKPHKSDGLTISYLITEMKDTSSKCAKQLLNGVIIALSGLNNFKNTVCNSHSLSFIQYDDSVDIIKRLCWNDIKNNAQNKAPKCVAKMKYNNCDYWAINGNDKSIQPNNLLSALEITMRMKYNQNNKFSQVAPLITIDSKVFIVPLHDDVKCYIFNKTWIKKSYFDYTQHLNTITPKPREKQLFNCCERKLLSILHKETDGFIMYVLKQPCSKCTAAFRYLLSIGNMNFEVHCAEYDEEMEELLQIP